MVSQPISNPKPQLLCLHHIKMIQTATCTATTTMSYQSRIVLLIFVHPQYHALKRLYCGMHNSNSMHILFLTNYIILN